MTSVYVYQMTGQQPLTDDPSAWWEGIQPPGMTRTEPIYKRPAYKRPKENLGSLE
jgi:hypothetical protein